MAPTGDERFARLKTDPRFRRPKQKQLKVEIDDRFKDVLESEEFGGKGSNKGKGKGKEVKVDKRGRPITSSHQTDQLKRFYQLKSPSPGEDGGEGFVDYARGQGDLESSGSEDDSDSGAGESDVSDEELELGGKRKLRLPGAYSASDSESGSGSGSGSGSDDEDDEDHLDIDLSETDEPASAFPAESEIDQEEEEEEDDGPTTDPTNRIACVNLDWDNLQAADLYAVFSSFLRPDARKIKGKKAGPGGKVVNVKIYPSEFGKERMKKEEEQGPGGGMFISAKKPKSKGGKKAARYEDEDDDGEDSEDEEDSELGTDEELGEGDLSDIEEGDENDDASEVESDEEQELGSGEEDDMEGSDHGGDFALPDMSRSGPSDGLSDDDDDRSSRAGSEDIDMGQLRQYQLERLRYYYAVATFSSVEAAEYVMAECNGTEFERTANVFDLTYVPEGMEFEEDDVKDVATKELKGYKGNDFVTDALRHSKVKLTWDQDDPNRAKFTRKALTREEIEEQDFKNLVAGSDDSDSDSGSEEDTESDEEAAPTASKGKSNGADAKAKEKSKKAKAKERKAALRALLLKGNDEDDDEGAGDIWGKAGRYADVDRDERDGGAAAGGAAADKHGGMEITFKSALADGGLAEDDHLTSLERYQMRQKEKKARKKEKLELKRAEKGGDAAGDAAGAAKGKGKGGAEDDFFGDSDGEQAAEHDAEDDDDDDEDDYPHDQDPEDSADRGISGKAHSHFSMKDIVTDEKTQGKSQSSRRKRSAQRRREEKNAELGRVREKELGQEGWKMDVKDPRFKALHEEAEFAIDPSNPAFIKTKAMQDMLAERSRVRKVKGSADRPPVEKAAKSAPKADANGDAGPDLAQLVKSVKRKAELGSNGAVEVGKDNDAAVVGGKKRKRSRGKKGGAATATADA